MFSPATSGPPGRNWPGGTTPRNPPQGPRSKPLLRTMLGDVLRRIRLEQRRTLADVSRAAKVSMPYLSELERGRKEASSEVLAAICTALSIDLAELLAQVGRELTADHAGRRPVLRLEPIQDFQPAGDGELRPDDGDLLPDPSAAETEPCEVIDLGSASPEGSLRWPGPFAGGPASPICRLAA